MSWNYRVVRHVDKGERWYAIHEVYYNDKALIYAISKDPVYPHGTSPSELRKDMALMQKALDRPPIAYDRKFAKSPFRGEEDK